MPVDDHIFLAVAVPQEHLRRWFHQSHHMDSASSWQLVARKQKFVTAASRMPRIPTWSFGISVLKRVPSGIIFTLWFLVTLCRPKMNLCFDANKNFSSAPWVSRLLQSQHATGQTPANTGCQHDKMLLKIAHSENQSCQAETFQIWCPSVKQVSQSKMSWSHAILGHQNRAQSWWSNPKDESKQWRF